MSESAVKKKLLISWSVLEMLYENHKVPQLWLLSESRDKSVEIVREKLKNESIK